MGGTDLGGTIYAITYAGVETDLVNLDGLLNPVAGLLNVGGVLYGTTGYGGTLGTGTVFALSLSPT